MHTEIFSVDGREVEGFVVPCGPFNIVGIKTDKGLVGCGAFDVGLLDKFSYPAARISGVATCEDLLKGEIREANQAAQALGIRQGMTGRQAVSLL